MNDFYKVGYEIGLTWNADWVPGGPFVYTARESDNSEKLDKEVQSREENAQWRQGWRDGMVAQGK